MFQIQTYSGFNVCDSKVQTRRSDFSVVSVILNCHEKNSRRNSENFRPQLHLSRTTLLFIQYTQHYICIYCVYLYLLRYFYLLYYLHLLCYLYLLCLFVYTVFCIVSTVFLYCLYCVFYCFVYVYLFLFVLSVLV